MKTLGEVNVGDVVALVNWAPHNTGIEYYRVESKRLETRCNVNTGEELEIGFRIQITGITTDDTHGVVIYKEKYNKYKQREARTYNLYSDVDKSFEEVEVNLLKRLERLKEDKERYEKII